MPKTFVCSMCHEEFPVEDCTVLDDRLLCPECRDEYTCVCSRCGDRFWQEDSHCDENLILCQVCFDECYEYCADCGRLVETGSLYYLPGDDSDCYCEACYGHHAQLSGIQNYYYKPEPIFYGDGLRYLGVELEIDRGGESDRNAVTLCAVGNGDCDHIYIKRDGSLQDGLEIVTHPMTLDYHRTEMPWKLVLQKALDLGYISHQAGTCGLHVHVNRSSLGETHGKPL